MDRYQRIDLTENWSRKLSRNFGPTSRSGRPCENVESHTARAVDAAVTMKGVTQCGLLQGNRRLGVDVAPSAGYRLLQAATGCL